MGPMRLLRPFRRVRQPLNNEQRAKLAVSRRRLARELATLAGFCSLISGIAGYDWRLALIAAGLILQLAAIAGAFLQPRR